MKYLQLLGKFLISVGVGVLLFVAYTLWGTGYQYHQAQGRLEKEFAALPEFPDDPTDDVPPGPPEGWAPGPGDVAFQLHIPKIWDEHDNVVEGVGEEELQDGPGHYPQCRDGFERPLCTDFEETWPGQDARVVISGHRTTYGAPFWDLNKLEPGDPIITITKWGRFVYRVTETKIVEPDSQVIVIPGSKAEIVLTTCNPRFSADERLIVFAEMESG
jgi:sortase A